MREGTIADSDFTASSNMSTDEEEDFTLDEDPPSPPPLADPRKKGFLVSLKDLWDSVRITVFVLGTATILFIAASNTITW